MPQDRQQAALDYHALPRPGKIAIEVTKPCATQEDLALAYTPGVAVPVRAIADDPANAYKYTAKGIHRNITLHLGKLLKINITEMNSLSKKG